MAGLPPRFGLVGVALFAGAATVQPDFVVGEEIILLPFVDAASWTAAAFGAHPGDRPPLVGVGPCQEIGVFDSSTGAVFD